MSLFLVLALSHLAVSGRAVEVGNVEFSTFKQAVFDSFDDTKPFEVNFFEVLAILCPESVFCQDDEKASEGYENSTQILPGLFATNTSQTALQAREIVRRNVHQMKGCCKPCSCNKNCHERKTCCPFLVKTTDSRSNIEQNCVHENIRSYLGLGNSHTWFNKALYRYYMVTDCFDQNGFTSDKNAVRKCTRPDVRVPAEIIPVYSNATERIYRNQFCAACNNDTTDVTPWSLVITIRSNPMLYDVVHRTPEQLYEHFLEASVRVTDLSLEVPYQLKLKEGDFICSDDNVKQLHSITVDTSNFLHRACLEYQANYIVLNLYTYFNVFCALASLDRYPDIPATCKIVGKRVITDSTFTALLNLQEDGARFRKREDVAISGDPVCPCTKFYDRKQVRLFLKTIKCQYM